MRATVIVLSHLFGRPSYVALAILVAVVVMALALWLPNLGLLRQIMFASAAPVASKIGIALGLLGAIGTNYTVLSAMALAAAALLFGANVALLVFGTRARHSMLTTQGSGLVVSLSGVTTSLVGIGCAACGSLVLAPVLSFLGAGGLLAALPWAGEEFVVPGLGLLLLSVFLTARGLASSGACPLPKKKAI